MGPSNVFEKMWFDWLFKQTAAGAPPTALFVSLHSGDPGDTGANEISGNGYARAQLDPDVDNVTHVNWNAIDQTSEPSSLSNKLVVQFPEAVGGPWNAGDPLTHFGIWTASTSGTVLWSGTVAGGAGIVVTEGITVTFAAGSPGQLVCTVR